MLKIAPALDLIFFSDPLETKASDVEERQEELGPMFTKNPSTVCGEKMGKECSTTIERDDGSPRTYTEARQPEPT